MYYKLTYIVEHVSGKVFKRYAYFLSAQSALETLVSFNRNLSRWKYYPVGLERCNMPENLETYPENYVSE